MKLDEPNAAESHTITADRLPAGEFQSVQARNRDSGRWVIAAAFRPEAGQLRPDPDRASDPRSRHPKPTTSDGPLR